MRRLGVLVVGLVSCESSCLAQVVAVFDGTTYSQDGNGNITVPVGVLTTNKLLRVFDPNSSQSTLPTQSLFSLTVSGTASGTAKLSILVASADTMVVPSNGQILNPMPSGIVNFGTLNPDGTQSGGITFTDSTLRDASVLALSASGNIHGDVAVGRVFTMQAVGVTNPGTGVVTGGDITANVSATADDLPPANGVNPVLGELAIGVITAYNGITGDIIAGSLDTNDELTGSGSIGRVRVTSAATSPAPRGIGGDIRASKDIRAVYTTGDAIKNDLGQIRIEAGRSITDIRTIQDGGSGALIARRGGITLFPCHHLGLLWGRVMPCGV